MYWWRSSTQIPQFRSFTNYVRINNSSYSAYLRCARINNLTEQEKNRQEMTFAEFKAFKNRKTDNLSSKDEYVNEKLSEINECFVSTYNSHLKNIDDTIKKFEQSRDSSKNAKTKAKYEKAIKKLQEIRRLFVERYKFIQNYSK